MRVLGPFKLTFEGADLGLRSFLGDLEVILSLGEVVQVIGPDLLAEPIPLDGGIHQSHDLEK